MTDLHHKLRRDPNWHPNGCNICGQLGHQASTCPNGTVNWKEKYGEQAFELRINHDPKLYRDYTPLEWEAMMRDLKKKSTEYMEMRQEVMDKTNFEELAQKAQEMLKEAQSQVGMPPAAAAPPGQAPPPQADPLPEGWAAAKDTQGRTYYWFKKTQKVQWEKPTAESDTGENPPPAAAVGAAPAAAAAAPAAAEEEEKPAAGAEDAAAPMEADDAEAADPAAA